MLGTQTDYFNSLRTDPPRVAGIACETPGCARDAPYRAPVSRTANQRWRNFCLEHVQAYNKNYNFFAGMSEAEILAYQESAIIGHRPCWGLGRGRRISPDEAFRSFFKERRDHKPRDVRAPRTPRTAALEVLGLSHRATPPEISARFKQLVKRYHPDAGGRNKRDEERLIAVIQAYHCLKTQR